MGREGVGVEGDEGHTANNVLSSTRPTAALRRLPLTNKYPMSTIESADKTIKAIRQLDSDYILSLKSFISLHPQFRSQLDERGRIRQDLKDRTYRYHLMIPFDPLLGFDNSIQSPLLHHYEQPCHLDHLQSPMMSTYQLQLRPIHRLRVRASGGEEEGWERREWMGHTT